MFFCGLLLGIKIRPKLIQKEPFGGYIGVPDPDHPAKWQLPTPKKNNFNPQKKARALAAPLSWPRHGRVQSRGSTAHDHATRFELSCDLRAASNWGVLHVCHRRGCHRSHPLACAPPLAAVGIRRLELALSRLLPFLAPEESQWRSHHISLSLCPAALPTVSRRQTGPSLSRRRPSPPQPRSFAQPFATRNVAVRERSERKQTETMSVLGCRHTL